MRRAIIAWMKWWWHLWRVHRAVYVAHERGDPMATARAVQLLERIRIGRPWSPP